MDEVIEDIFSATIAKDSRKRIPIARTTYELLHLKPGDKVRVHLTVLERSQAEAAQKAAT